MNRCRARPTRREGVLEAGVRIDASGLQTHMHQGYPGEEHFRDVLDRSARYGLPLRLTETTLVSGDLMPAEIVDLNDYQIPEWPSTPEGEARQADEITRHYRSLVAHPAVASINYWGLSDEDTWVGVHGFFGEYTLAAADRVVSFTVGPAPTDTAVTLA